MYLKCEGQHKINNECLSGAAARTGDEKQKDNKRYMKKERSGCFIKTKKTPKKSTKEENVYIQYVYIEKHSRNFPIMDRMEYNIFKRDNKLLQKILIYQKKLSGAAARTGNL